jgi:hypothetical protein
VKTHTLYERLNTSLAYDLSPDFVGERDVAFAATSLFSASLLKKATDTVDAVPERLLEQKAFSAFEDAERACMTTNAKFLRDSGFHDRFDCDVQRVLLGAQRKIARLVEGFKYVDVFARCGHGPGVSVSVNADQLGVDTKYDESRISVNRTALPIFRQVSCGVLWPLARGIQASGPTSLLNCELVIEERDKLAFVPKSATSLRSITVGPTANVYLQLGLGRWLSERLNAWGINLRDQTLNSDLARYGSYSGALATLDLKAASDHLSYGLVQWIIPQRLFWVLDALRSKGCLYDGRELLYHKFSGMGNGFTFPLQTLIFHALTTACCDELGVSNAFTATYGDDIIVPVQVVDLVKRVLTSCGFVLNDQKSFVDGPFRESCGGQYFNGIDIRPVYFKGFNGALKKDSLAALQKICLLAHQLVLWRDRMAEHSSITLRRTLGFLKTEAFRIAKSCGVVVPFVPVNAPLGTGFPEPWVCLDEYESRMLTFTPDKRKARDPAMYAFALDGGLKETGNVIASRSAGTWKLRRRRLFLGKYAQ